MFILLLNFHSNNKLLQRFLTDVTTYLEKLEMSGNLAAVQKFYEISQKSMN